MPCPIPFTKAVPAQAPAYHPPRWLPGGHLQTIWPLLIKPRRLPLRRERWDTPDGDFIDVDFLDGSADSPLLVLFHGLEGSANSHYARTLAHACQQNGWRLALPHFRGCSGELNRRPRAYHSGDSQEIDWIIQRLQAADQGRRLYAIGVSLGGNALLKWAGEQGERARQHLLGLAAVCPPLDLAACGHALARGFNQVYTRHFLGTLKARALARLKLFPGLFDASKLQRAQNLWAFDDAVTGPIHGFAGADDYWARCSAKPWLKTIAIPTLVISPRNDPFLPEEFLPSAHEAAACVHLEQPEAGGHVGFVSGTFPGHLDWLGQRLVHFFNHELPPNAKNMNTLPAEIFKAYDIRGIVGKSLTPDVVHRIGHALGSLAIEQGQTAIAVGRDGRLSGPALSTALMAGICAAGCDAIDIGCVPTPVTYFAAYELGCNSCVSVTGSHNPPDYNGLKMVIGGTTLALDAIQALKRRAESADFKYGQGQQRQADVSQAYIQRIVADVKLSRPVKIVMDCGNGVAGAIAPALFSQLGCEIIPLYCEVDGHFPNHHPDPSKPENLTDVIRKLQETDAEIGIAFDGDGDRLGVVTKDGEIIYPDRQLMLFAADVLSRVPGGQVIYDVKCSRLLSGWIRQHGGEPVMWNTGHALVKAKLKETGAPLAGEMSGHTFFKERWYGFDDGLYSGARLLEILSRTADLCAPLKALPNSPSTPEINIKMAEGEPFALIEQLKAANCFAGAQEIITIDGLRVEYSDGFGLARPSNTTPVVVLRFEADHAEALARIQADFRSALTSTWPGITLPF